MPRKGENIYKRKDGRWEGRVLLKNGKYHSVYARSYREVREKMKSAKGPGKRAGEKSVRFNKNAADLFEAWLTGDLQDRLKPSTYESYYRCIKKYVLPYFQQSGNEKLTDISVAWFIKDIKENSALSQNYRRKILTIFKIALREITKAVPEYASLIPNITLPRLNSSEEVLVFTMNEQRILECVVEHSENKKAWGIILCFYTGIRIGELCALKWSDFDVEAGTMSVTRTVTRIKDFTANSVKTRLHVGSPKSKTSLRKIPLPAFLLEPIKKFKLDISNEDVYILSGSIEPLDPRIYQRVYKKVLQEAGVKNRKFHAIRHTFATRALELGVDIKTLSEILGHSNVSITLNIYAHSLMEQKKIAIDKFNKMHITQMQGTSFAVDFMVNPVKIAL